MTQQIFSAGKEGDGIYLVSQYGDRRDDIAIPPNQELEFKIYNGPGAMKMDFTVGIAIDSPVPITARSVPTGLDFDSHRGFGWEWELDPDLQRDPTLPPPFPTGGGGGHSPYVREPLKVALYQPGASQPIHSWQFSNEFAYGEREMSFPVTTFNGNPVFIDPTIMQTTGWWTCRVSHGAPVAAHIVFWSKSYLQKAVLKETILQYRWLNHAFTNVMSVLTPRASISNHHLTAGILDELSKAVNIPPIDFTLDKDELTGNGELLAVETTATLGSAMKAHMVQVRDSFHDLSADEKRTWNNRIDLIDDNELVVKITALFSNPTISFAKYGIDGAIRLGKQPVIYIPFANSGRRSCFVDLGYRVLGLSPEERVLFSTFDSDNYELLTHLNETVANAIVANFAAIQKYFRLALGKACGKIAQVDTYRADGRGWVISHYDLKIPDPNAQPGSGRPIHLGDTVNTGFNRAGAGGAEPVFENVPVDTPPPDPGYGVFPDDFKVSDNGTLARLDKVKTLVVIMMENRSFDHFLGNLARAMPIAGDNYTAFPLNFTNKKAGSFAGPIPVIPASQLGFTNVLVTPVSPEHEYDHVLRQISDGYGDENHLENMGQMQGFTTNILERFNDHPETQFFSPQMVMSYYEGEQLPMYYFLAAHYKVLDHWFAAHPGPTWPNRIAMTTGKLIGLRNFSMLNDDRIGYFREPTVFDTLSRYGIDWRYLESNVSILRLFDAYRTDIDKVAPLKENDSYTLAENNLGDDPYSGLELLLRRDTLPRVIFIDPRFSDAPPIKKACDDLAPTNIGHGQHFIRDIYKKLFGSRHAKDIALIITYDEHGGFFDHVPPPGTPPSGITGIDPIHPDGPSFMGVRVPAFLVSSYVSPHSVSHAVFDHTSILKSILVHNRRKIPRDAFSLFSERVKKAEHIGVALDLDVPGDVPPAPDNLYGSETGVVSSGRNSNYRPGQPLDIDDFHEVLRTLFMPEIK